MAENKILPFAEHASLDSADVLSDFDYADNPIRIGGNLRGMAKRAPNNKALKQGTLLASAVAQFLADEPHGVDVTDQLTTRELADALATKHHLLAVDEIAASDLVVHTSGDETIDGLKSFKKLPVALAGTEGSLVPALPDELVNKKYVDDKIVQAGGATKEYVDQQDAATLQAAKEASEAFTTSKVGDLSLLETTAKGNAVEAINEVNSIVRFKVVNSVEQVLLDKPCIYFLAPTAAV